MTENAAPSAPRGIRLNNPLNIRHGKDKWQGKAEDQTDTEFVKFTTAQFGIRAAVRVLITYEKKGYNTVRAIINRWAPPSENDTGSYIDHVAAALSVHPDDEIDVDDFSVALPLIKTMIQHENGQQPYSDKLLTDSLRLAGIHNAPNRKLTERGGFKTQATATVASGLGVAAAVAEPIKKAADGLEPFQGSPIISQVVIGLLTIAGGATLAGVIGTWIKARKGL